MDEKGDKTRFNRSDNMNPLEKYPHLFANGRFGVMEQVSVNNNWMHKSFGGELLAAIQDNSYGFKLIARPIKDMTDEEVYSLPIIERCFDGDKNEANPTEEIKRYLIRHARKGTLPISDALAMGDIGYTPLTSNILNKDLSLTSERYNMEQPVIDSLKQTRK